MREGTPWKLGGKYSLPSIVFCQEPGSERYSHAPQANTELTNMKHKRTDVNCCLNSTDAEQNVAIFKKLSRFQQILQF